MPKYYKLLKHLLYANNIESFYNTNATTAHVAENATANIESAFTEADPVNSSGALGAGGTSSTELLGGGDPVVATV
jgi:hypothetical protein